jgi:hypothetical protein
LRVRILLASGAVALLAVACSRSLDTAGLEDQIASLLRDRGGPQVSEVACPDDVKVAAGDTFDCTATGEGTTWTVQVTQVDDRGNVNIEIVDAGS